MTLKVNITLSSAEHFNLLIEAIIQHRTNVMSAAQDPNITPAQNAELVHKARQLYTLLEEISK